MRSKLLIGIGVVLVTIAAGASPASAARVEGRQAGTGAGTGETPAARSACGAEVDITNTAANRLLSSLGAHRTGGSNELVRPWPAASSA